MSSCYSPSSSSSYSSSDEPVVPTMDAVVADYTTEALIEFLQKQSELLDDSDLQVFRDEKIKGVDFLTYSEVDFRECGLKKGPSRRLATLIEDLKQQKIRCFSSYRTVEELKVVFKKYKVNGEDITCIRQFDPGEIVIYIPFAFVYLV
jgi:hypothetical protein